MRLDRFISNHCALSRKQTHQAIKAGRVTVDGLCASKANTQIDPSKHHITLDSVPITVLTNQYLMLHKPAGTVCATIDSTHPTVLDLLPTELIETYDFQIVGRLDLDTTGLVLLTTDGQWNHAITAPNKHCKKQYQVALAEPMTNESIQTLEAGITLKGETKPTKPCTIEMTQPQAAIITLQEGKYHQVKRMFAAVGNCVVNLHRVKVGSLTLDENLAEGQYRVLSKAEVAAQW